MSCLTSLYFFLSLSLSLVFFSLLSSSMAAEMDGNGGGGGLHAAIGQGQSGGGGGGDDNDLDLVSECSRCVCRQWPMQIIMCGSPPLRRATCHFFIFTTGGIQEHLAQSAGTDWRRDGSQNYGPCRTAAASRHVCGRKKASPFQRNNGQTQ